MRNLFPALLLIIFAMTGFAGGDEMGQKVAFCAGELDSGERIEVSIFRGADGRSLRGSVSKNGRHRNASGALVMEYVLDNPDTRAGMIEYKLQSNIGFAAETSSYYTMLIYADKENGEVSGKQFIHYFRRGKAPSFGNIECAGTIQLN
jgi:hypothetical protein